MFAIGCLLTTAPNFGSEDEHPDPSSASTLSATLSRQNCYCDIAPAKFHNHRAFDFGVLLVVE